ncbi:Cysteine protease ATG4C-like protein, partial [Dinothrombium tinctorium]
MQNALYSSDDAFEYEDEDESNSEKMKTKLMSLWNNVKYGWSSKLKTTFSTETPIWFLGVCYFKNYGHQSKSSSDKYSRSAVEAFKHDYFSRIWFTYRREFPKLYGSQLTSDCGWGCMLRSGQMMLAHAFLCHYSGRDWRWCGPQSDKADMIHRMIVKWFVDDPDPKYSPFSVHQLVKCGTNFGKKAGDWFGPSSVAHILRDALNASSFNNPVMDSICIYVAQDCTVYIEDVFDLCSKSRKLEQKKLSESSNFFTDKQRSIKRGSSQENYDIGTDDLDVSEGSFNQECNDFDSPSQFFNSKASSTFNLVDDNGSPSNEGHSLSDSDSKASCSQKWRGVVIFVPVRLGGDKFNPIYSTCIQEVFMNPACIGIIGGRPKHALFFCGVQDDKLIYLDPHYCQEAVEIRQTNFPLHSFHCSSPRKMQITRMDPSCTIGFYCHTKQDIINLVKSTKELKVPSQNKMDYPLFLFTDKTSSNEACDFAYEEQVLRARHLILNREGSVDRFVESEEFHEFHLL